MKRKTILLAILLLSCAFSYGKKKETVCQHPAFSYAAGTRLIPEAVTLRADGTTITFAVRINGSWRIDASTALRANGQALPLLSGRVWQAAKDTGEWVTLSTDSAYTARRYSFQPAGKLELTFPPLPKGCQTFDFVENGDGGEKSVTGIRTDGKQYPTLLAQEASASEMPDGLPEFRQRMGRISLTVKYLGDMPQDAATSRPQIQPWNLDELTNPLDVDWEPSANGDGGTLTMRQGVPFTVPFSHGNGILNQTMLFVPGDSVLMEVDVPSMMARKFIPGQENRPYVRFTGKGATLAGVMNEILKDGFPDATPDISDEETQPLSYADYLEASWQKLCRFNQRSDSLFAGRKAVVELARLFNETQYIRTHSYQNYFRSWQRRHGLKRAQADSLYEADGYAAQAEAKDPHAAGLEIFKDGLRLAYAVPNVRNILPYMEHNGATSGQVYEWLKRRNYGSDCLVSLMRMSPLSEAQLDSLLPQERPIVEPLNERCKETLASIGEGGHMNEVPQVAQKEMLPAIVARYKGKVVFIDLWATWCGPCKNGIKAMRPAHALYEGKDVVFVYVTNMTSSKEELPGYVRTMPGEHYVLENFSGLEPEINGIPRYLIYDKEGKLAFDFTGFGKGMEEMLMEKINELLAQ